MDAVNFRLCVVMSESSTLPPGFDLLAAFRDAAVQRREEEVAAENAREEDLRTARETLQQVQKNAEGKLSGVLDAHATVRREVERAKLSYPTQLRAPSEFKAAADGDPGRELEAAANQSATAVVQAIQTLDAIRKARRLRRLALVGAVVIAILAAAVLIRNGPTLRLEWMYRRGVSELEAGNYEGARSKLQQLLAEAPSYRDAGVLLNESYYRPGSAALEAADWRRAQDEFTQLVTAAPDYRDAAILLRESYYLPAEAAVQQSAWAKAAQSLVHLQQLEPDYRGIADWPAQHPQLRDALAQVYAFLWTHSVPLRLATLESPESEPPLCLAFSPDAKYLAAGWTSGHVSLWDVATGRETERLEGHSGPVTDVAFSPNGEMVATASADGKVGRWHVLTGQAAEFFDARSGPVRAVAYSPDGKTIASAGADGAVRLWSETKAEPIRVWTGHSDAVRSLAFSADGKSFASVGADRVLRLWDPRTGDPVRILSKLTSEPIEVALSPSGDTAWTVGDDGRVIAWRVADGSQGLTFGGDDGNLKAAAFDPSREVVVLSTERGRVKLWETAHGHMVASLPAASPAVSAAFSWDGRLLALGSSDGSVTLWSVRPASNDPILLPTPTPDSSPTPSPAATVTARPSATPSPPLSSREPIAEVVPKGVNIRQGPATSYPIIAGAYQGDKLVVLGRNPDCSWWQVRTTTGKIGWVAQYLLKSALNKCDPPAVDAGANSSKMVAAAAAPEPKAGATPMTTTTFPATKAPTPSAKLAATKVAPTTTRRPAPTRTPVPTQPPPDLIASSVDQFSGSQGHLGWSYMWEGYGKRGSFDWKPLPTFDGNCWRGDEHEPDIRICAGGEVHPGWGSRVAYQWKSTVSSKIQLKIHLHKLDTCGDGVQLTTYRFADQQHNPLAISGYDTRGRSDSLTTDIWQGDLLYFVIDIRGEPTCDKTQVRVDIYQQS